MSIPIFTAAPVSYSHLHSLPLAIRLSVHFGPLACALAGIGGIL
jgi:hypothetical protein